MQTVTMSWTNGMTDIKSSGPVGAGEVVEFVFDAPSPLPTRGTRLVAIRQQAGASEGFTATYQGKAKMGNLSNGVSFQFSTFPPTPGRNVVSVTATNPLAGLTCELKPGAV